MEVRPAVADDAIGTVSPSSIGRDAGTDQVTAEEVAAWQLPPAINMSDIATLTVLRPTTTLVDL